MPAAIETRIRRTRVILYSICGILLLALGLSLISAGWMAAGALVVFLVLGVWSARSLVSRPGPATGYLTVLLLSYVVLVQLLLSQGIDVSMHVVLLLLQIAFLVLLVLGLVGAIPVRRSS